MSTDQHRPGHGYRYRIRDVEARSNSMRHLTQRTCAMVLAGGRGSRLTHQSVIKTTKSEPKEPMVVS